MLTEATVEKSFRNLFSTPNRDESVFERAEELLEELRDESPLPRRPAGSHFSRVATQASSRGSMTR